MLLTEDLGLENKLRDVMSLLKTQALTVATAESCTGGLFAALLTALNGSSEYFLGAIVSYHNAAKVSLLNVPQALVEQHGAVSEAVAVAMVQGCHSVFGADLCLSVTGIAGPSGGSTLKPVGTVWSALAYRGKVSARKWQFSGDRTAVRTQSCYALLDWLHETISMTKN